jgi:predicted DNA-binding protein
MALFAGKNVAASLVSSWAHGPGLTAKIRFTRSCLHTNIRIEFNSVKLEAMFVGRNTRILGFSVAPEIAEEYDRLAQRQKKSKSELFRQMVESYKANLDEEEFFRLQARMARRAQRKRIFTEKEVEKIVFEDR